MASKACFGPPAQPAPKWKQEVVEWLRLLLGLPDRFSIDGPGGGVIQDSASSATLLAMLAAREKAGDGSVREHGVGNQRLVSYVSELAHSSFERAAMIAGLGRLSVRRFRPTPRWGWMPKRRIA